MVSKYTVRDADALAEARRENVRSRWARMTPQDRSEYARKMALARWSKKRETAA